MIHKRTTAKLFVLGLCGVVAPCLAFAIGAPSGPSLEQIDATLLGVGQEPASAAAAPGWAIQVGAYADRAMADARLAQIAERAPDEVARATRLVTSFEWDNGRMLYRARFGGLDYRNAQAVCAILSRRGESCFVVADQLAKPDHENVTEAAADPAPPLRGSETAEAQTPATVPVADTVAAEPVKVAVNTVRSSLLSSASQVNNDELSDMRGGFFTAAGAHFDFGASVQTMVNGQLALQTNVQWTPAGAVTQQLAGLSASIQSQVAANLANAGIGTTAANVATNATGTALAAAGNTPVAGNTPAASTATPAAVAPAVTAATNVAAPAAPVTVAQAIPVTVGGLSGVQIPGATGGSTQVFANVAAGQIQNIILNSASNQTITQNTNVTLTIYNFPAWQQQLMQNAVSSQLAHEILAASGVGGH
jgi:SPOR domain